MQSYSFNSSIKPNYVNNQHFIRKQQIRKQQIHKQQIHKLYKKDNSYKVNNHCAIIPIKIDNSPQLDNSIQVNPGRALFSRCRKLQCSICLEKLYKPDCSTLECNHKFHTGCINEWRKVSNTCPFCRAIIRSYGINMNTNTVIGGPNTNTVIGGPNTNTVIDGPVTQMTLNSYHHPGLRY